MTTTDSRQAVRTAAHWSAEILRPALTYRGRRRLALCALAVLSVLAAGAAARAEEPVSAAHAHGGWDVEVELAPAPELAGDPWSARTVLDTSPHRDPSSVAWLDGFQRQASHLGMSTSLQDGAAPDESELSMLGTGLKRIARTIPAFGKSVRDLFGGSNEPGKTEPSDEPGFTQGAAINASFTTPSASKRAASDRLRTVSVLPGGERRATAASAAPCSSEMCFGRDLIKWNTSLGACTKDVRIGVIDTSFDLSHPAFKRLRVVHRAFIDGAKPSDEDWHGTAILSLLAGDPDSGTPGLVPDATFLLATAFRSDAAGSASADPARLLEALNWLDSLGVDVVNMSFSGPPDADIARAIERMSLKGVMFVAAAGNMGPAAEPSYPGAYPHVIAVTAVNRDGEGFRNANRGSYIDVAAPGVDVLTALPNGKQGLQTGTSFAVPFVTAILATRASSGIVEGTEDLLLERIKRVDLGAPGRDAVYGVGLALAPEQCAGASAVAQASAAKKAKRQKPLRAGLADIRW
jgi:hypothetical protein